jgi:hypothetical protein
MIETCTGWILDIYIENNEVILWIKTEEGKALRLTDSYEPRLYILPKTEEVGQEIIQILSDFPMVKEVKWQRKFTSIFDFVAEKLICVRTSVIPHHNLLIKSMRHEKLRERIYKTFNGQLAHIQRYLFEQVGVAPSSLLFHEANDIHVLPQYSLFLTEFVYQ